MVMPILAAVLGAIMLVGGLIPNLATNIVNNQLRQVLQNARTIQTRIVKVPSYGLLSGAVERLEVTAEGFKVQGLEVESVWLGLAPIKMNGSKMFAGQIELEQSSQAEVKLIITQKNLDDFLQSERVREMLSNIQINIPGLPNLGEGTLAVEDARLELKPDRLVVSATIKALGGFVVVPLRIAAGFNLTSEDELILENVTAEASGSTVPAEMIQAMLEKLNPVLDLRKFSNENIRFRFRSLAVDDGRLTFVGAADIRQIPKWESRPQPNPVPFPTPVPSQ